MDVINANRSSIILDLLTWGVGDKGVTRKTKQMRKVLEKRFFVYDQPKKPRRVIQVFLGDIDLSGSDAILRHMSIFQLRSRRALYLEPGIHGLGQYH